MKLKCLKLITRKLWLFSLFFIIPRFYFCQSDTVRLLLESFKIRELSNYVIPSEYYRDNQCHVYGDTSHIFFLKNRNLQNINGFTYEDRIVILDSLNNRFFNNTRVHFRIDSIHIDKNKACLKISAILTEGLRIMAEDFYNSHEIWNTWPKEQINNMTIEIKFRRNRKGDQWKLKTIKTKYTLLTKQYLKYEN